MNGSLWLRLKPTATRNINTHGVMGSYIEQSVYMYGTPYE